MIRGGGSISSIESRISEQESVAGGLIRDSEESEIHKKAIERIAFAYSRSGYSVRADHIESFEYPDRYRMFKPDVVAEKGDKIILIEVETRNSLGTQREKRQREAFSRWAKECEERDFLREVVL